MTRSRDMASPTRAAETTAACKVARVPVSTTSAITESHGWAIFGLETLGHYNELVGQHQPASAAVMYSMGFTVSDCHERSPRTRVASQPSERGVPRHDRAAD